MCWKLEHSFWIVSEKNGHICWRNVVFWLAHVQIKSAGACKTPASMYGLLCIHKTSDLRLSFRMFDMLQTFLLKSFRKKKKKNIIFLFTTNQIPRAFEQSIPRCIENLPILPFLSFRKWRLGDKDDIGMIRLEGSLQPFNILFPVCRIRDTFIGMQCTDIHLEPFSRVWTKPLCSPPTNMDRWRKQNAEDRFYPLLLFQHIFIGAKFTVQ